MSRNQFFVMLLIVAVCAAAGLSIYYRNYSSNEVYIEPKLIEDPIAKDEHEPVTVQFTLVNPTSKNYLLKGVSTSCGCMKVETWDGKNTTDSTWKPLIIAGNSSHPIKIQVATDARSGTNSYQLVCNIQNPDEGSSKDVGGQLHLRIHGGLRVFPKSVSFHGNKEDNNQYTVAVLDAYPEPGIKIAEIVSSHPDIIHANIESLSEPAVRNNDETIARKQVRISVTRPNSLKGMIDAVIKVIPENPKYQSVDIQVFSYEETQIQAAIQPSSLSISNAKEGDVLQRVLWCQVDPKHKSLFKVISHPKYIESKISDFGPSTMKVDIKIQVPTIKEKLQDSIILGIGDSDTERTIVPLTIIP